MKNYDIKILLGIPMLILGVLCGASGSVPACLAFLLAAAVLTVLCSKRVASLRNAAERDALTGLGSRYRFDTVLQRRYADKENLAVIYFDIDCLKATNDRAGHKSGDALLCAVADILANAAGDGDCCRIGGDEFVLVTDAGRLDDCLRRFAEGLARYNDGHDDKVGVSFGAAIGAGSELLSLVERADADMYSRKTTL